ncbi:hypothetical protein [Bartonella sp. TP]|uniref:hypothetical protein n=1 Tax=Bartonella sp. TP TaxID=3057550 RepID=UPI0025B08ECC|nr:hypothetical protein [Bartonella sp. TP]MDN5249408.1 hypothetical protein [Alphaproteobacteria bacterium]WJW79949.1 hypothetical protein QVL57_05465 [Bartonella sp. TP]
MKFILPFICIFALSAFALPKIDSVGKIEKHGVDIIYYNVKVSGQTIDKIIIHNLRKTPLNSFIDMAEFYSLNMAAKLNDIVLKQSGSNVDELNCSKLLLQQNDKILASATKIKLKDSEDNSQQLLSLGSFALQSTPNYTGSATAVFSLNNNTHNLVAKNLNIKLANDETIKGLMSFGNVKGLSTLELFASNFTYANLLYKTNLKKLRIIAAPQIPVSLFAIYLLKDHMPQLLSLLNITTKS